jgi:hypothetical protein
VRESSKITFILQWADLALTFSQAIDFVSKWLLCRAPSLGSADSFELLEIHGRAWHPDIVSELACVHLSIFEHAEIDRRTEQSVRWVCAEAPFNVWSVDAAHLPGELDCRPFVQFRPLTLEAAGSSPFFARPFGSEMGAKKNGLRRLFFLSG